ncbi:MAG: polysaccharide deacetylase family protein [Sphingomonadales bacterium]|mgnify:CR=1 FL=1
MSLNPSYLEYPHRSEGMDHAWYPYSNIMERPAITWPDGKKLALLVQPLLEYFPLEAVDKPFKAPGHMVTPYPDLRHYSSREYGTRVGYYRFLDAFAKHGIKATVAMNAAIASRYPSIAKDTIAGGHEIIAHSTDMNGLQYGGMSEDDERALIADALTDLEAVTGSKPAGWRSVAQTHSFGTLDLLAEHGVRYTCDWVNDDLPYAMNTKSGPLAALPVNHELSDRQILVVCQQSAESYVEQIKDAALWLLEEADKTGAGRMLTLTLTPYIAGLPYRIDALEGLLDWLSAQDGVWSATGSEIVKAAGLS